MGKKSHTTILEVRDKSKLEKHLQHTLKRIISLNDKEFESIRKGQWVNNKLKMVLNSKFTKRQRWLLNMI